MEVVQLILTTAEKFKKREPVEWALDYIEESLSFLMDSDIEQEYKIKMIYASGRDLAQIYRNIISKETESHYGMLMSEGFKAGKVAVLRLLVKATPCPAQQRINSVQKILFYYASNLNYLKNFFSGLSLNPSSATISLSFVTETVKIAEGRGLNPDLLEMNGYPLLFCSMPYEEEAPACYLNSFHTVFLFANNFSPFIQRHIILHEIGHILFDLRNSQWKSKKAFAHLLSLLQQKCSNSKVTSLKNPRHKFMEELCADLFATYFLYPDLKKKNSRASQMVFCEKLSAATRLYLLSLNHSQ